MTRSETIAPSVSSTMRLRVRRDMRIMRRNDDRVALAVQLLQKRHHLAAVGAVERAGRFIRQDDRAAVHQGAGDRDTLLLAARKLVWAMRRAIGRPSRSSSANARRRRSCGVTPA